MSDVLASQVAAGEVVERPASVVKELIENSIDAGATMIRVEIVRGGISMMKVTDNGCGMSRQDALMCLERHATSKLTSYDDLSCIANLGFRGEALPSIASVAELRIMTRREADMEGTIISCSGGVMEDPQQAGCAPGTEICVNNLFFNTPVRRKFLKSNETEAGHIEHEIKVHALAYPNLRFVYVRDGQLVFDWPATSDLRQRIADFAGRDIAAGLLRIKPQLGPGIHVSGYLMPLSEARRNRRMQFIFLNTRSIEDKIIARAIRDGYGGFPTGLHPALFLYLEVEPALVDVNVHPAKKEVRFLRPSDITNVVMDAVSATLAAHARGENEQRPQVPPAPVHKPLPADKTIVDPQPCPKSRQSTIPVVAMTDEAQQRTALRPIPEGIAKPALVLKPVLEPIQKELTLPAAPVKQPTESPVVPHAASPCPEPVSSGSKADKFRYVGTCAGKYLLYENAEGLVLLSPGAARERILYERLLKSHDRPIHSQRLLQPVMLDLDAREIGVALEVSKQLERAGFRISHFGQRTLRVDGVPMMLSLPRVDEFLLELIRSFSSGEMKLKRARNPFEPYAQQLARQYSRKEDLRPWLQAPLPLLSELLSCEIPYCTPNGKPTMVPLSLNELSRKFQAQ